MTDSLAITPTALDPSALSQGLSPVQSPALRMHGVHNEAQIDKTAKEFEAVFATEMLQPMFKGVDADPIFGGGHGEETMRVFLLREYGRIIADSGKLGIAAKVKAEMLKSQESAHTADGVVPTRLGGYPQSSVVEGTNYGTH